MRLLRHLSSVDVVTASRATRPVSSEISILNSHENSSFVSISMAQQLARQLLRLAVNHSQQTAKLTCSACLQVRKRSDVSPASSSLMVDKKVDKDMKYVPELMDMKKDPLNDQFDPEFIDMIGKAFPKTFNLAAYANRLPTIQKLIDLGKFHYLYSFHSFIATGHSTYFCPGLGVDLSRLERKRHVAEYILKLDFEKHCKDKIRFLVDVGVHPDNLGTFLAFRHPTEVSRCRQIHHKIPDCFH